MQPQRRPASRYYYCVAGSVAVFAAVVALRSLNVGIFSRMNHQKRLVRLNTTPSVTPLARKIDQSRTNFSNT
jgi:hypothetical protein